MGSVLYFCTISISQLEEYFKTIEIPQEIKIDRGTTFTDVPKLIDSHLTVLKTYGLNNNTFSCFYDRLMDLKKADSCLIAII